LVDETPEK